MIHDVKRDAIESGDLLAWGTTRQTGQGGFFLNLVRLVCLSEYGHVGIAVRQGDELYVVEATSPEVQMAMLTNDDSFYHIPMRVNPDEFKTGLLFLQSTIGLKYSYVDALCGFLGIRLQNKNRWQCAELACTFYEKLGISLGNSYTPSRLVEAALDHRLTACVTKINSQ